MDRIETTRAPAARRAALVAAALAFAAPAGAATPRASAPLKPVGPPAAATPAPAAKQPALPAPPAPARPNAGEPVPRVTWIGGAFGALQSFDVGKSIAVHADYGISRTPPAALRGFELELHLVVGFARPAGNTALSAIASPGSGLPPVQVDAGEEKLSAIFLEVIPTARVLKTLTPGFALFLDGGLGLAQSIESYDRSEIFAGRQKHSEYATGLVLRLGLGMAADVAPRWRVVLEPLLFDLMIGPKFSAWTPTLGVAYRL